MFYFHGAKEAISPSSRFSKNSTSTPHLIGTRPQGRGEAEWRANSIEREVVIERTDDINTLPSDDAFAHLETQFKFLGLLDSVEGGGGASATTAGGEDPVAHRHDTDITRCCWGEESLGLGLGLMHICSPGLVVPNVPPTAPPFDEEALRRQVIEQSCNRYLSRWMWPDLIKKSKDGGLDIIETYVFWNLHEPNRGQFDFTGRKDLVKFIKLVGEAVDSLFGCIFLPGIQLRTDNEPYKIENEYGNVESEYGSSAKPYIDWAAQMATSMNTGVPWVMCQQDDAPDPMINTCNGFYCDQFTPNSDQKLQILDRTLEFSSFGDPVPYRPAEDVAFAAARLPENGTLLNYYMYHGGTNFGGLLVDCSLLQVMITMLHSMSLPKWGHLKDLHKAIKLCEEAMVATVGNTTSLGQNSEATVYQTESGQCAAFLANWDGQLDSNVYFNGNYYDLPAWSVSILPDCKNVVYNTAKVNSITAIPKFVPQPSQTGPNSSVASFSSWSWFKEPVGISINRDAFVLPGLVEQINTTADKSDFMWYSLRKWKRKRDISRHSCEPRTGNNTIDLLSLTMGLQNYGAFFDLAGAGITGPVQFKGLNNGSTVDLSSEQWTYQVGLKGERVRLPQGISKLWVSQPALPINTPLTWYKTTFSAPPGNSPVAIDFTGMGKGQAWINGQSIGRYWPANISPQVEINASTPAITGDNMIRKNVLEVVANQLSSTSKSSWNMEVLPTVDAGADRDAVVRKACMGKPKCSIEVTVDNLGEPCANVTRV
ncbi:hypothetical protein DH2020_000171 [Rehmannia glutinosa]|uniref:beta-galactosidase n=1 Tax=Rehmannia glutinosa TaxID=99300 RepID=A0ABR0XVW3_REHGL